MRALQPFPSPVLCLDIGSGTQDVLLFHADREPENCPKLVLPAPAKALAARIGRATAAGRGVHLHGSLMGGGFGGAVRAHLAAGLPVSATEGAALSLADDLDRLRAQGVRILPDGSPTPEGHEAFLCADFDPVFWERALEVLGLPRPELVAACVQDHGFHPGQSNRRGRFALWERLLGEAQGRPESLLYDAPPPEFTRLAALQQSMAAWGGGPVADTGAAAVLGALFEPSIRARAEQRGLTLLNLGNSHTIAFLLFQGRIFGVYEHHTGLLDAERLLAQLTRFCTGALGYEEVFDDRGHGALCLPLPKAAGGFGELLVLGPRRGLLADRGFEFPAPGGDMMLAGAFGLVQGLRLRGRLPVGGL